jgi:hypothetical protein
MSSATLSQMEFTVAISVDSSVTIPSLVVAELSAAPIPTATASAKEGPSGSFLFTELDLDRISGAGDGSLKA